MPGVKCMPMQLPGVNPTDVPDWRPLREHTHTHIHAPLNSWCTFNTANMDIHSLKLLTEMSMKFTLKSDDEKACVWNYYCIILIHRSLHSFSTRRLWPGAICEPFSPSDLFAQFGSSRSRRWMTRMRTMNKSWVERFELRFACVSIYIVYTW